jgi:hypothetical protein
MHAIRRGSGVAAVSPRRSSNMPTPAQLPHCAIVGSTQGSGGRHRRAIRSDGDGLSHQVRGHAGVASVGRQGDHGIASSHGPVVGGRRRSHGTDDFVDVGGGPGRRAVAPLTGTSLDDIGARARRTRRGRVPVVVEGRTVPSVCSCRSSTGRRLRSALPRRRLIDHRSARCITRRSRSMQAGGLLDAPRDTRTPQWTTTITTRSALMADPFPAYEQPEARARCITTASRRLFTSVGRTSCGSARLGVVVVCSATTRTTCTPWGCSATSQFGFASRSTGFTPKHDRGA